MATARLTFRDKCADVCWQKQLRDHYEAEGSPPVDLNLKTARVRPISRKAAAQVIMKYEWLGAMAGTGIHFGLFFGPHCAGVTCVAAGGGTGGVNTHKMFGVERKELATLARGACVHWAPAGTNSKLVSWTCRLLNKPLRIVIAYSDSDAGEIGTIYQACGWVYLGKGSSTRQWVSPQGRVMDQKLPYDLKRKHGGTRREWCENLRRDGWTEQPSNPKGRYVKVLDKKDARLIETVERLRKPYPKRVTSDTSDTPSIHEGKGGAAPTVAL